MISIAIVIVSSFGSIRFLSDQSPTEEFFGISVGFPECFLLSFFFSSLLIVFEVYDHMTKEEREQQAAEEEFNKTEEEFNKFSGQINEYREFLKRSQDNTERLKELREKLLICGAIIYGRFKIPSPVPPPRGDSDVEWQECKEKWRVFLDTIYLCSEGGNLSLARKFAKDPVDLLPPHNQNS